MTCPLGCLIARESRVDQPVVNLHCFSDWNFRLSAILIFCVYGILYGSVTALPSLLQNLFGYNATWAGLVMSPAGFFAILMMPVVAWIMGRGNDPRILIISGLLMIAAGSYWYSLMTIDISPWQVVWPRVVQIVGMSLLFAPLNVSAFTTLPMRLRASAVGLYAFLRNEGGSVGTSLAKTLEQALTLAYFDAFWAFAVLSLCLIPLVLVMKRPSKAGSSG